MSNAVMARPGPIPRRVIHPPHVGDSDGIANVPAGVAQTLARDGSQMISTQTGPKLASCGAK